MLTVSTSCSRCSATDAGGRYATVNDLIPRRQGAVLGCALQRNGGVHGWIPRRPGAVVFYRHCRRQVTAAASVAAAAAPPPPAFDSCVLPPGITPVAQHTGKWYSWWVLTSPVPEGAAEEAEGISRTKLWPLVCKMVALVSPERRLIILATIFMILAAAAELAIPHFATRCIFSAAEAGATAKAFQSTLTLLTSIIVFYGVMSAMRGYCFSVLNNRLTMNLRTKLFGNLIRRETSFFDGTDTGSLTSRLQADCQGMTKCVATNLNIAFRNMLQAIGGTIYLGITSPVMCAATLGVCVVLWSITLLYGEYARRTQKIYQDTLACGNQVAEEVLSLTRVVRTFGTEKQEEQRYRGWLQQLFNVGLRQATGYGMFVLSGYISCYMTKVVALALGCTFILQGTLTAEQLTNFIFYVEFVTYASLSACDEVVEVMEAVGASERVLRLLDSPSAAQVAEGDVPAGFSGRVEFRNVSFRYPTRPSHLALSDVSVQLEPGRLVALVGLSGSGKTTLVALLQRLYDPTSGTIYIDGHDLMTVDSSWYRNHIGVVNQEPRLFGTTVAANIAYGWPQATQADIEQAARDANAHEFITALPQQYQTKVTDSLLSGGQKQRVALARALVRKPKLLVLDEATSALDAESEAQVQQALDAAMQARDRTVVVIAHRLSTVRNADEIIVMDKGRIVERGDHESLLRRGGSYARLVSRQLPSKGSGGLQDPTLPARPSSDASSTLTGLVAVNGCGNGGVLTSSTDDESLNSVISGTTSSDESVRNQMMASLTTAAALTDAAVDPDIAVLAAAAVTAENELASKTLGSQDPIDYLTQGN